MFHFRLSEFDKPLDNPLGCCYPIDNHILSVISVLYGILNIASTSIHNIPATPRMISCCSMWPPMSLPKQLWDFLSQKSLLNVICVLGISLNRPSWSLPFFCLYEKVTSCTNRPTWCLPCLFCLHAWEMDIRSHSSRPACCLPCLFHLHDDHDAFLVLCFVFMRKTLQKINKRFSGLALCSRMIIFILTVIGAAESLFLFWCYPMSIQLCTDCSCGTVFLMHWSLYSFPSKPLWLLLTQWPPVRRTNWNSCLLSLK